jgi:hypothetical protein
MAAVVKPGDMILVRGKGWLARGILKATGCEHDGPSHLAVAINDHECIEALTRVTRNPLTTTLKGCERAWVLSFTNLSDAERERIDHVALAMEGLSYGYVEIGLQLADSIFRTTWFTDRWSSNINRHPICSYVGARAYDVVLGQKFDKEDQSVTPGDVWRYGLRAVSLDEAAIVEVA